MIAFVPGHVVNFREFKVLLMLNHIRSAILKVCESKFLRNGMIFFDKGYCLHGPARTNILKLVQQGSGMD